MNVRARRRTGFLALHPATGGLRVLAAAGTAAAASFVDEPASGRALALLLVGTIWLAVTWRVLVRRHAPSARAAIATLAVDGAAMTAIALLYPGAEGVSRAGLALVVTLAAFDGGLLIGGAAIGLFATSGLAWGVATDHVALAEVGASTAALAGVLTLFEVATRERRALLVESDRLAGKAEAVLDRVADAIVISDGDGRVVEWNRAADRLLGGSPDGESHPCADALGLHVGERRLDCARGCALLGLQALSPSPGGVEVWRPGDEEGARCPYLASAAAVHDATGRVTEVVHSLRDVTALKQADEAKTLFLATASHELKTPLTVIGGFADALLHVPDLPEDTQREALEAIRRRSVELTAIVERLLLSSRIEAGRVDVVVRPTAVAPIIVERVSALEAATGRVVRATVDELPDVVVDGGAFTTVLDHLLDNAVKYSPGGGAVEVEATTVGPTVAVEVRDHGVGMTEEQAARCFEKFWQAESTDERRFGGTGIGLYIVRSLVEAMGGTIDVASRPGAGTTFTMRLAVDGAAPADDANASSLGERTMIQEFMRQLGVPTAGA